MDSFDFGSLNYWAILVAVVFNQALGAAWYSTLAKPWMAEVGLSTDPIRARPWPERPSGSSEQERETPRCKVTGLQLPAHVL